MVSGPRAVTVGIAVVPAVAYNKSRSSLAIANLGTAAVYYGNDAELTTASGFPIPAGAIMAFSKQTGDDPRIARHLISGTAGQDVRISDEFTEG